MRTVTSTRLRRDASALLTEVEGGESLVIVRHGKPIAELVSYSGDTSVSCAWKVPGLRLKVQGASLAGAILDERDCEKRTQE